MEILDIFLWLFLVWVVYDTVKEDGIFLGLFKITILFICVIILVFVPIYFGRTGKIIMYVIFGIIGAIIYFKKSKQ